MSIPDPRIFVYKCNIIGLKKKPPRIHKLYRLSNSRALFLISAFSDCLINYYYYYTSVPSYDILNEISIAQQL